MKNNVLFFLFLTTIRVAMVCFFISFFLSIRAPTRGAIPQSEGGGVVEGRFNPRTYTRCDISLISTSGALPFQSAHLHKVRCDFRINSAQPDDVSIRAPTRGAILNAVAKIVFRWVSIRAPTRGAMATQSKIRPIRGLTPPHRSQNRRILGNPSPQWHPCARPLQEKRHRFYDHLWIALERFIGSSHRRLCCGCKFSVVRAKRPCFGLPRRPTKRRIRPY